MPKKNFEHNWSAQSISPACETVECAVYDPNQDFRGDPSGFYTLIRINFVTLNIEVAVCSNKHVITAIFHGRKAQDVYEGIFRYEGKHKLAWFKSKGHIAYLGKELKKAEIALALGQNTYFQE